MAKMGHGYGSEFHLLRFLGRHRKYFDKCVKQATGAQSVDWLDFHFKPEPDPPTWDRERRRLDFLPEDSEARKKWKEFWPGRGQQHNWDAVGRISTKDSCEWLLVEAKSYPGELIVKCKASKDGGLPMIKEAFELTKKKLGIPTHADWLNRYYQHANRITALNFMMENDEYGRLLSVYFCGDRFPPKHRVNCPKNKEGWLEALCEQDEHLGLSKGHPLAERIHKVFLPVTNVDPL